MTLNVNDLTLDVGQSSQVTATIVGQNGGQLAGISTLFSSANTAIATTTPAGLVSGVASGTTTIHVVAGSIVKDLPVVVRALPHTNSTRVPIGARPFGAAISNTGTVLVTQQDADSLTRVELATPGVTTGISVGRDPGDVVFDASGNTAFVRIFIAGTLGRVDLVARRQTDTLSLGGSAYRVLLSADGNKLFVASGNGFVAPGNGTLRVVHPSTLSVLATIAIPLEPNGIARIGDRLYVSSASAGTITEINLATNSVARTLPIGGRPQDIAPSTDGSEMYVANEWGTVAVVTIATGAIAAQLPVDEGAFGLALAPDGYLYVALSHTGKVVVIDPKTRTTRATITTGGIPRRIAPDPKGSAIVVPNEGGWADILR